MSVNEPDMTAFLRRLVPDFEKQCVPATPEQIGRLEWIAGRPLPAFYQWFLRTMGRDVGPFATHQDFSIDSILAAYDEERVEPHPRLLLIAGSTLPEAGCGPALDFYDLDQPARDDALVLSGQGYYEPQLEKRYETFREMFACDRLIMFRIQHMPRYCKGTFTDPDHDVSTKLGRIMTELGFASPVPTGPYCQVLERADSAMAASPIRLLEKDKLNRMYFDLGGQDEPAVRRLLEEISAATALEVKVEKWESPAR